MLQLAGMYAEDASYSHPRSCHIQATRLKFDFLPTGICASKYRCVINNPHLFRYPSLNHDDDINHSSLPSLWNLNIMYENSLKLLYITIPPAHVAELNLIILFTKRNLYFRTPPFPRFPYPKPFK
jgi:hypothetical protein